MRLDSVGLTLCSGRFPRCNYTHGPSSSQTRTPQQVNSPLLPDPPFSTTDPIRLIELKVKTVKYFKSIERVQEEVEEMHAKLKDDPKEPEQVGSME